MRENLKITIAYKREAACTVRKRRDETSNDLLRSLVHFREGVTRRREFANVSCTSFRLKASIADIVRSCVPLLSLFEGKQKCASCRVVSI